MCVEVNRMNTQNLKSSSKRVCTVYCLFFFNLLLYHFSYYFFGVACVRVVAISDLKTNWKLKFLDAGLD